MGHIRVCPKCEQPFVPKTDNWDYCKPAHGVAYRAAESAGNTHGDEEWQILAEEAAQEKDPRN